MTTAIIQARVGSTRFPNKIFAEIVGKPLIWHVVDRMRRAKKVDKIVLATTRNPKDDRLYEWAKSNGVICFRGDEIDVLGRFYGAALFTKSKVIARITADDPFKDPEVTDRVIERLIKTGSDFAFNNHPPSFPEGLDTEVFTMKALKRAALEAKDQFEREHVTQYFYKHPELFKMINVAYEEDISHLRWTIDRQEDLDMTLEVYRNLYKDGEVFLMDEILRLLKRRPDIAAINASAPRSHMYAKKG